MHEDRRRAAIDAAAAAPRIVVADSVDVARLACKDFFLERSYFTKPPKRASSEDTLPRSMGSGPTVQLPYFKPGSCPAPRNRCGGPRIANGDCVAVAEATRPEQNRPSPIFFQPRISGGAGRSLLLIVAADKALHDDAIAERIERYFARGQSGPSGSPASNPSR